MLMYKIVSIYCIFISMKLGYDVCARLNLYIAVLHQAGDESNFPGLSRGVGKIVMDFVADGNLIGVLEPIVGKFY